jgi:hypothetical protein
MLDAQQPPNLPPAFNSYKTPAPATIFLHEKRWRLRSRLTEINLFRPIPLSKPPILAQQLPTSKSSRNINLTPQDGTAIHTVIVNNHFLSLSVLPMHPHYGRSSSRLPTVSKWPRPRTKTRRLKCHSAHKKETAVLLPFGAPSLLAAARISLLESKEWREFCWASQRNRLV